MCILTSKCYVVISKIMIWKDAIYMSDAVSAITCSPYPIILCAEKQSSMEQAILRKNFLQNAMFREPQKSLLLIIVLSSI